MCEFVDATQVLLGHDQLQIVAMSVTLTRTCSAEMPPLAQHPQRPLDRGATDFVVGRHWFRVPDLVANVEGDQLLVVSEGAIGRECGAEEVVVGGSLEEDGPLWGVEIKELASHDDPEDLHRLTLGPTVPPRLSMIDTERPAHGGAPNRRCAPAAGDRPRGRRSARSVGESPGDHRLARWS